MQILMKPPSSSFPSLLRVRPRLSSYLFTLLAFTLFAAIIYGHDFLFVFHPHLLSMEEAQTLVFSTHVGSSNERNKTTVTETKREEEEGGGGGGGCDVFNGRWVRDELTRPLYEESDCPYIQPQLTCQEHGRPEKEYQRWRWQPHACDLPT
ncbi:unnamed protein product [Sphenostylis stenocarpa]|uniref:Trichome birefringence-like N-terminal domain-containing protein n=1 Tax=Sphenostylis stenocarpa TaxID=92480 RepID=A0AA86RSE7_9FABA|nr:unnamed protein product [Sphenostylis stenocarpa]